MTPAQGVPAATAGPSWLSDPAFDRDLPTSERRRMEFDREFDCDVDPDVCDHPIESVWTTVWGTVECHECGLVVGKKKLDHSTDAAVLRADLRPLTEAFSELAELVKFCSAILRSNVGYLIPDPATVPKGTRWTSPFGDVWIVRGSKDRRRWYRRAAPRYRRKFR
jgi:hypothetical protein